MKNKEKYAKEILEIACSDSRLAFDKTTNKVVPCSDLSCSDCLFGQVRAWINGTTSWTANGKSDTWTYAKLAEPNNT